MRYLSSPLLLLRALQKLLNFVVLLVGLIHLAVQLRSADAVRVGDQETLCLLRFGGFLRFNPVDSCSDVLKGNATRACRFRDVAVCDEDRFKQQNEVR